MASKRYTEFKELGDAELQNVAKEKNLEYQKLKFDHSIKGLDNPMEIRNLRRDISRIMTELRSRELGEMTEAQLAKRSKIRARRRK